MDTANESWERQKLHMELADAEKQRDHDFSMKKLDTDKTIKSSWIWAGTLLLTIYFMISHGLIELLVYRR